MMRCRFCGKELSGGEKFCSVCGARIDNTSVQLVQNDPASQAAAYGTPYSQYNEAPKRRTFNIPMIVWAIINILVSVPLWCGFVSILSSILGVIALVFAFVARDGETERASNGFLKVAKILNIIATCVLGLAIVLITIFIVFAGVGSYYFQTPTIYF